MIYNLDYLCNNTIKTFLDGLTFIGDEQFSIKTETGTATWDRGSSSGSYGIKYSTDMLTWYTWSGEEISSQQNSEDSKYYLYLDGENLGAVSSGTPWVLNSNCKIRCVGNLQNFRELSPSNPNDYCFAKMFYNWDNLIQIPDFIADYYDCLGEKSFYQTFYGCTSLTYINGKIMSKNSTYRRIKQGQYDQAFYNCSNLTYIKELFFIGEETFCNCNKLKTIGNINISINGNYSCQGAFKNCSNLEKIGDINIDVNSHLSLSFEEMFLNCSSLKIFLDKNKSKKGKFKLYVDNPGYSFYLYTKNILLNSGSDQNLSMLWSNENFYLN